MRFTPLNFSHTMGTHLVSIVEQNDRYDLRIDNQSFSNLYLEEKTKQNFKREDDVRPAAPVAAISSKTVPKEDEKKAPAAAPKAAVAVFEMDKGFDFGAPASKEPPSSSEGFTWNEAPKFSFSKKQPAVTKKDEPKKVPAGAAVQKDLLPIDDVVSEKPAAGLPKDLNFGMTAGPESVPVKETTGSISSGFPTGFDFFGSEAKAEPTAAPLKKVEEKPKPAEPKKSILDEDIETLANIVAARPVAPQAEKAPVAVSSFEATKPAEKPKGVPSFGAANKQVETQKEKQDFFSADFQF